MCAENIFTKIYMLFVFQFLIMKVICSNQWNILEITVHNEKNTQLPFLSYIGNLCNTYHYNFTYIYLRLITIVLSISHSIFYGFAGWTVPFGFGGFPRCNHACFHLSNSWNYRSSMDLRYVNLQTAKHTELRISC